LSRFHICGAPVLAIAGMVANGVIRDFRQLSPQQKQDLLNFLRSL
jgi:hypothetical protein